jgi:hypothetical protein
MRVTWVRDSKGKIHAWEMWPFRRLCDGLSPDLDNGAKPVSRPTATDRCPQCDDAARKLGR